MGHDGVLRYIDNRMEWDGVFTISRHESLHAVFSTSRALFGVARASRRAYRACRMGNLCLMIFKYNRSRASACGCCWAI